MPITLNGFKQRNFKNAPPIFCLGCSLWLALFLTGCSDAKEQLGIGVRQTPDEFAIVKEEPLTLPPNYHLRPPKPGAPRPQARSAQSRAQELVTGDAATSDTNDPSLNTSLNTSLGTSQADLNSGDFSNGEDAFLQQAGAQNAAPNIRNIVDSEQRKFDKSAVPVAKKIFGLYDEKDPATIVDPKLESKRIRDNITNGDPINTGETPVIEDK